MSCIASAPLTDVSVHTLQVREHCSPFARNHLPQHASLQALRSRPNELTAEPRAPGDRRTVALTMPTRIREVEAASTTPLTIDPVQRVAAHLAPRADHSRPDAALATANRRHGPL